MHFLQLPEDDIQYGKFGLIRLSYLKEEKKSYYTMLLIQGQLIAHLNEVDHEANYRMEKLVNEMATKQGVRERLKIQDQMKWVGMMNNIRSAAEEIVLHELIYV